ncbi:MAG: S9 family peptidase [Chloroflexi bacterium]|nr:S9 family peptidase [Chloroflexota bacterium]
MPDEKRPLTAEDLYKLQLVGNPQLSPDGKQILFTVNRVNAETEKKYSDLWLANSETGALQQFTYGDYSDTHPRWSPDGSKIAFLSNRKNGKMMQIFILPLFGGEARPVTDMEGTLAGFEWSPDGKQFVTQFRKKDEAAVEREKDPKKKELGIVSRHITSLRYKGDGAGYLPTETFHIWTIDADTGEGTQLTDGDLAEVDPHWSPDGKQILFISNRHPQWELNPDAMDMYLVLAAGGEMQKVDTPYGRKHSPSFSPDGQTIAYLGAPSGDWYRNHRLYIVPTAGGEARNLTGHHDITLASHTLTDTASGTPATNPTWTNDGRFIYVQSSVNGCEQLRKFSVEDGSFETLIDESGAVLSFNFNADQSKMAYLWGSIEMTEQLHLFDVASGEIKAITSFNQELFDEIAVGTIEEVWFSGNDGNDLQGWILKPPGFDPSQKYPSILEIHGGPMAQYGRYFMHEFNFLAANGYVVYFTNPRGGQGYGEAHLRAIMDQWGTVDYDDVMSWADYIEQQPYIDTEHMGVTGGSYGGYMTTLIIGKTHRFKAAVAQRLVSNLISFYGSSDMNWATEGLIGSKKQPWNDLEGYWKQSPIAYIGNAKTPTLVIHSEMDFRCDREQGEQVFAALQRMGVDSEMVLFPGESHGLSRGGRTDRRIERLSHMLRWFDKYLK